MYVRHRKLFFIICHPNFVLIISPFHQYLIKRHLFNISIAIQKVSSLYFQTLNYFDTQVLEKTFTDLSTQICWKGISPKLFVRDSKFPRIVHCFEVILLLVKVPHMFKYKKNCQYFILSNSDRQKFIRLPWTWTNINHILLHLKDNEKLSCKVIDNVNISYACIPHRYLRKYSKSHSGILIFVWWNQEKRKKKFTLLHRMWSILYLFF